MILPAALAPLAAQPRWVVWKWVIGKNGKPTKPPFQGSAPRKFADTTDPTTWCDLETAMLAYVEGKCDGIGFVLTDSDISAVDLDACRNATSGQLHPWALEQMNRSGSYCEVTPSEEGTRIIGLSTSGEPLHCSFNVPNANGVRCELYRRAERYITITGRQIGTAADLTNIDAQLDAMRAEFAPPAEQSTRQRRHERRSPWGELNERALANLGAWVPKLFPTAKRTRKGGYRVKSADLGRGRQEDLSLTPKGIMYFGDADMGDLRQGRRSPIDCVMEWKHLELGEAVPWLEDALGQETPKGQDEARVNHRKPISTLLPPPSVPMGVARVFVAECCLSDGVLTLHHWRGGWWQWRRSHWCEVEDRAVRSLLYAFTENASYLTEDGKAAPWAPTRRKIGDLLEALAAITILADDIDQPTWLDGRSSGVIVAVANGLLEVQARRLIPHSPWFFNQTAVPFNFNEEAPQPNRWCDFLDQLWPEEPAAVDALAEWFGYIISGRLDLHKILLMVGPTRGGKGVIARVLTALIGRANVAGPTLNSLGGEFGLAPLIGKSLAVISDARFVGKNSNIVVERLLSISGEDTLTVNRKYRDQWTGKLPSRLHVISNELPHLGDASTAIVGRILLLPLSLSWLGKEDYSLEPRLNAELPGILNWSLEGLERLTKNDNRFTRVQSAEEAVTLMRDLASPVGAFVRERCKVGADKTVAVDKIYAAYRLWCDENGHTKVTKATFGRDLRAAIPSVKRKRPREEAKEGEDRVYIYAGIALAEPDRE